MSHKIHGTLIHLIVQIEHWQRCLLVVVGWLGIRSHRYFRECPDLIFTICERRLNGYNVPMALTFAAWLRAAKRNPEGWMSVCSRCIVMDICVVYMKALSQVPLIVKRQIHRLVRGGIWYVFYVHLSAAQLAQCHASAKYITQYIGKQHRLWNSEQCRGKIIIRRAQKRSIVIVVLVVYAIWGQGFIVISISTLMMAIQQCDCSPSRDKNSQYLVYQTNA